MAFIVGKCSEIIRKTKRPPYFFCEKSALAVPEPLAQLLAAAERQPEEGPAQQRVVDIPSARFGVAVEDVEECHGGAGQPPEVDHAGPGGKGPVVEMHAVDVDQLEAVGARGGAVPEDVAVVEVPVLDAFLVELHGEAGEGLQHGQGPRCGKRAVVCDSGV